MRSKIFRIGFGVSLAAIIGVAGMFGGVAVLPKTVLAESESFSTEAGGLIAPKADDPVIFTTERGLDIKIGQTLPEINTSLTSGALTGYPYFTMGTYNSIAVNWVVIGKSTNMSKCNRLKTDSTPAGLAITSDISASLKHYVGFVNPDNWDVVTNAEIPANCVLVMSEKIFCYTVNIGSAGGNYETAGTQTACANLYNSDLGLTSDQKAMIVPQTLTNLYYPSNMSTSTNQYMFPLAARGEEFDIQTYLTTEYMRKADYLVSDSHGVYYLLRSGTSGQWDNNRGGFSGVWNGIVANVSNGASAGYPYTHVRPAFVLSLV